VHRGDGMQVQNKLQLSLFSDIVGQEYDYKNDFVTYIETSSSNLNVVHKNVVTSLPNITKKTIKNPQSHNNRLSLM